MEPSGILSPVVVFPGHAKAVPLSHSQIKSILWGKAHAIFVGVQAGYGVVDDFVIFQAEPRGTSLTIPVKEFQNVEKAVGIVRRKIRHQRALELGRQFSSVFDRPDVRMLLGEEAKCAAEVGDEGEAA